MQNNKIFIAVAGNIGTGKTTLTQMLSQKFGWNPHFESVSDNPYLEDFYQDMPRWSFPLQIYFLNARFQAHQKIVRGPDSAIQDRSVYEDAHIFARNLWESQLMQERDYKNYQDLYRFMGQYISPPDLLIYLRKSLPQLKENIQKRGRDYERNIPDEYLGNLNRFYDEWLAEYNLGKKLIIESDGMDFVKEPKHFERICENILTALDQPDLFLGKDGATKGAIERSMESGPGLKGTPFAGASVLPPLSQGLLRACSGSNEIKLFNFNGLK